MSRSKKGATADVEMLDSSCTINTDKVPSFLDNDPEEASAYSRV